VGYLCSVLVRQEVGLGRASIHLRGRRRAWRKIAITLWHKRGRGPERGSVKYE
jgi:hypothetical protein